MSLWEADYHSTTFIRWIHLVVMTVRSHFRRAGRHEEKAQSEIMADSRMNGKVHQISRFLAVANQNQAHPRFQSETNSKSKEENWHGLLYLWSLERPQAARDSLFTLWISTFIVLFILFPGASHEDTSKLSIKHHLDTRAWHSWHRTLRKENLLLTFNPNPVSKAPLEKTSRLKITFAREHWPLALAKRIAALSRDLGFPGSWVYSFSNACLKTSKIPVFLFF